MNAEESIQKTEVKTSTEETIKTPEKPQEVIQSGVDTKKEESTPSTSPQEVKQSEKTAVEQKVEDKKEATLPTVPYNYVLCPKCQAEITEEYFYNNKKAKEAPVDENKGYTARAEETGDKVFLIRQNKRYWIKNPETLTKLGFNLGQEKKLPFSELIAVPEYEPVDLTVPGSEFPRKDEVSPEEMRKKDAGKPYRVWG